MAAMGAPVKRLVSMVSYAMAAFAGAPMEPSGKSSFCEAVMSGPNRTKLAIIFSSKAAAGPATGPWEGTAASEEASTWDSAAETVAATVPLGGVVNGQPAEATACEEERLEELRRNQKNLRHQQQQNSWTSDDSGRRV